MTEQRFISQKLIEQLKRHEGFRPTVYLCSAGKHTIGYGHNLDAEPNYNGQPIPDTIDKPFALNLLHLDIEITVIRLETISGTGFMATEKGPRRDVIINMAFNLGIGKYLEFRRLRSALQLRDYEAATREMENSLWFNQVGDRAVELVEQMRTNHYRT